MRFRKKGELLEYLGKDKKDVRLVDRMVIRGEVRREGSMYVYESKDEIIESLRRELEEKEKEIKNLEENGRIDPGIEEELKEARVQWEYWEKVAKRYGKLINLTIETVYKKIKPALGSKLEDFETFKEGIIEEVKEIESNLS